MTTTIQKLDRLTEDLRTLVETCSTSKNKKGVLASLSAGINSVNGVVGHLKEQEKRHYIRARKALVAISNTLNGMQEGLVENELTLSEFRAASRNIATVFMPALAAGLLEEAEAGDASSESAVDDDQPLRDSPVSQGVRNKIKIVISRTSEMREAVEAVAQSNTVGVSVSGDDKLSALDTLSKQARAVLPVRIAGTFQIVRVPIVPIFPNPLQFRPEVLKRLGLKFVEIEGFVILQDQILLNVSAKKAAASNVAPLAMAHSVVELLNERGGSKYEIVSDTPNANPRNTDLLMFWILPRQKMNGMMKVLGSSRKSVAVKWGLPLPGTHAETEAARLERRTRESADLERRRQEALDELATQRDARAAEKRAAKRRADAAKDAAKIVQQDTAQRKKRESAEKAEKTSVRAAPAHATKLQELIRKNQQSRTYARKK